MQPPRYTPADPFQEQPPWWRDRLKVTLVAAVGMLGIIATILLLIVMNARGGEVAVASPTATPSAMPSGSVQPSAAPSEPEPTGTPTSTASSSSSASPSPSTEARAHLEQGWNRISTALNLRSGPSEDSPVVRRLQAGEVVWLDSEPTSDDEYDWYWVRTLQDEAGHIASGPADDAFASLISNRFVYASCGPVSVDGRDGIVDGLRMARLNDGERAAFELAVVTGTRGCVRLAIEDFEPQGKVTLEAHACGAPTWDGSVMRLQPTTAGSVDDAWRVDATMVVSDVLLSDQPIHDDGLTNHKKVLILGSRLSAPFACVSAEFSRRVDSYQRSMAFLTEVTGCLMMTQRGSEAVSFAAANGGEAVRLQRDGRSKLADVPLNDARLLSVNSHDRTVGSRLLGDC